MKKCKGWFHCVCLFALGAALVSTQTLYGQAPSLLWQTNIGASVFAVDQFTNVYASSNGVVIKLSSEGVPLQTNILSQLRGKAQRDAAGNFYFAGVRAAFFDGQFYNYGTTNACFLAKFDSAGSLVWSNGFGPVGQQRQVTVDDMKVDSQGDAYVGITFFFSTTFHTAEAAKFDSTGSNVWTSAMPRQGYSTTVGVTRLGNVTPTNGYAITYDNKFSSAWTITLSRFDSNGAPTIITNWSPFEGVTPPLVQDADGNFYNSDGVASKGPVSLLKRTPAGDAIWSENVGFSDLIPIGPDSYGGVLLSDNQTHLLRYDADGNPVWTMNFSDICQEVLSDSSGNRFVSIHGGTIARIGPDTFAAPAITNQPLPQITLVGSNVIFSVGATGSTPLRYYWFFNNSLLSFQSNASLTLPNVATTQAGSYYVIASNIVNTATSAPVQLQVKQVALFLGSQLLTNGTYTFTNNPTLTVRSAFVNGSIFYTLDGSAPNFSSASYSGPFSLFTNATVRAIGYSADFSQSEEADMVNAVVLAHHTLKALTAGGGTINLNPPGGDYLSSDTVTATAVPDSGWSFLYWTGNASGSNSSVNLLMHSDKTIHAVFGTTLSTTVQGDGQVLLYPLGGVYSYGQTVRLTGVPGSGSYFGAWGNAGTGNTNPLYFTVTNANPTVSSIFSVDGVNQVSLTTEIHGLGKVSASPQANVYSTGQSVTLTATPDSGQTFLNWSGDASGTQNPLNIVLNQSQVITANFSGIPRLRISSEFQEGLQPEGFRFSLISDPNSIYQILSSSNLLNWDSLGFVTNTLGEAPVLDTNALNGSKRFYQIK